jgi:ADP-heptose:LPS heptosyltransferase
MPVVSDSTLVLFPGALGDFICFLPTLLALRRRHAGTMVVVAQPAVLQLLRLPETTGISIDRREIADLFADSAAPAPETRGLLGGVGSVYSWTGFGDGNFAQRLEAATGGTVHLRAFRGMQAGEHAVDYYARCAGVRPCFPLHPALADDTRWLAAFERRYRVEGEPLMVMHAGSGSPRKNWEGFAALARWWGARHPDRIIVLCGPAEMDHVRLAVDAIQISGLTLPQVVALLRRSRLYLGNDSGISHLAGAVGIRGVVLFGSTAPVIWAPRSDALQVMHAPDPCRRCPADRFCVHRLSVEAVGGALEARRE